MFILQPVRKYLGACSLAATGTIQGIPSPAGCWKWITQATILVIAVLGACGITGGVWRAFHAGDSSVADASFGISTLLETGSALESEIGRTVRPAMLRTDILAKDPQVIHLLGAHDLVSEQQWLNRAITTGTEVDALALFDATGHITAINSQYADGSPISPARIRRIMSADFGHSPIIQKCVRNSVDASVLEFQTHCDITPALFDSTGLSVAYSVPIFDASGRSKIGVISARLRFDRLSSLIQDRVVAGGAAKAFFVTDAGAYFSETINSGVETPPIPVTELRDFIRPLIGGSVNQVLSHRGSKYLVILPLAGFRTLEGGGIHTLIVADEAWLMRGPRQDRLLRAAGAGIVGTLLLIVAGLIRGRLTAWRMKTTAQAANAANAQLAAIVQSSADAVIGSALDGKILSWNPAAEKIFGYSAQEVKGRDVVILEPAERCGEIASLQTAVLHKKWIDHVETQRLRKDGQRIDVVVSLAIIEDRQGAPISIAITTRDNTRQKRAEYELRKAFDEMENQVGLRTEELSESVSAMKGQMAERLQAEASLRESEERFRQLAENTKDVFWMTSVSGDRIIYVSPRYEEIWGRTCQSLYDQPHSWVETIEPQDRQYVLNAWQEMSSSGKYEVEYRIRRSDGTIRWIRARALPVRDTLGKIYRIAGIAEDITDRRLADQQLIEAKESAERANGAKSEFLARMSHEIRTPLNGVVGMIDLLSASDLTVSQRRYAQLARDSSDLLLSVINDILDFSKIEAGKVEVEAIAFDLHQLTEDLVEVLGPMAANKKLALACFMRPEVPHHLIGDPTRIRQVLTNLINNALKFTPHGYVSIRVSLQHRAQHRALLRINVEDTGIGIPVDRLDRLFKSFGQVDTSTTRQFGGTGLGLAISKRLVELMGGEIGVSSEPGKGTTFWFTLDLGVIPAPDQESLVLASADALRCVRVLAVDPDPTRRQMLIGQLDGWFSSTSAVVSEAEALEALRRADTEGNAFTVAMIPAETAEQLAFAEQIAADLAFRQTKLIAVLDSPECDLAAVQRIGFVSILRRPLTQSCILDALASATVERKGSDAPARHAPTVLAVNLKGLHLLVAEDNEMNQFVTEETLRRVGCTCDIVSDGALAIEAVQRRSYDAVLMDCQMPLMDGLAAARRIREIEATAPGSRRVPIIALTADAVQGDREKCLSAGMDGYVTKPIDAADLFATINSLVKIPVAAPPADTTVAGTVALPSPPSPAEPPINLGELLNRSMRDEAFASLTLEKFKQRAMDDVELLRQGVAAGDVQGVTRTAHNLKSVAAHVAAEPLRKIAFEIEQAGIGNDLNLVQQQLELLAQEAKRCAAFAADALRKASITTLTSREPESAIDRPL